MGFGISAALLAESTDLVSTMTTAFGSTADECLDAIAAVVPVALPVMGAIVVVSIGIRIFRKVAGR